MKTHIMIWLALVSAMVPCLSQNRKGENVKKNTFITASDESMKGEVNILRKEVGFYHIMPYGKFLERKKKRVPEGDLTAMEQFAKLERNFKENQHINGIAIIMFWSHIEPKEGQYDFAQLKTLTELCKKYDKGFKFIIIPGIRTPKWVYNYTKSIKTDDHGRETVAPVPWDKGFKEKWKKLLLEVNKEFSPYEGFVAISLAGANHRWAETDMPRSPKDIKQWEQHGDYKKLTTDFWKEMIGFYANTFKKQHISIHIRVPFAGMYREMVEIIDTGLIKCPDRITLQNCQLTGVDDNYYSQTFGYVHHYRNQCHIGFQALTSGVDDPERSGSMEMLVLNLIQAEADYLEIFPTDGYDKEYTKRLHVAWEAAKRMGVEKYKKQLIKQGKYKESKKKRKVDYSKKYEAYHLK